MSDEQQIAALREEIRRAGRAGDALLVSLGAVPLILAAALVACGIVSCGPFRAGDSYTRYSAGGSFVGGAPCASPTGTAFVYGSPRSGRGDLFLADLRQGNVRQLTHGPSYEGQPSYFADGTRIAFVREDCHGTGHIWILRLDSGAERQLTFGSDDDWSPAVSPDGASVVFSRRADGARVSHLCRVRAAGGAVLHLTDGTSSDDDASFSGGGKRLYFCREPGRLFAARPDGSDCTYLGDGWSPTESPRGNWVAFVSAPYHQTLSLMRSDGTQTCDVYHSRSYKSRVSFTADGSHLLFLDEPHGRGVGDICVLDIQSGDVRRVRSNR